MSTPAPSSPATGTAGKPAETEYCVGFSRITVTDRVTREGIKGGIWYPTQAREARVPEQSRMFSVARDAMPVRGSYPLIVASHGSGAWFGAHHDTAEHLARRGFVVASVTHPGDNHQDLSGYLGTQQLLGRPRHLKLLVDYVLGTHKYGSVIDRERIGVLGFSEGGYAVTVLMGGRPDFGRFQRHAEINPNDPILLPHWELTVGSIPADAELAREERVRAAVLMAPAFGFLFDRERLAEVNVPVRLYRAEMDNLLRAHTHVEPYLKSLPLVPEYRVVKGAGHYAFLSPCPENQVDEDPDTCRDRRGFNRVEFHRRLNDQIHEFFARTLGEDAPPSAYGLAGERSPFEDLDEEEPEGEP